MVLIYTLSLEEKFSAVSGEFNLAEAQSQSPLFRLLPQELRKRVWRHAIGSQKIHLTEDRGGLVQAHEMLEYYWSKKTGLLNLPLVCRAAYVESISYLYSSNIFCFGFGYQGSKLPIVYLHDILPKQHIASIRHVQVAWHLARGKSLWHGDDMLWDPFITITEPDSDELWEIACAELAGLSLLQSLVFVIWTSGDKRAEFVDREATLLQPLVNMKHLEHFDIYLPWAQSDESLWEDAPFYISRRFQDHPQYDVSIPLLDNYPWGQGFHNDFQSHTR